METVLHQVLLLKGEEASQFLPQKGVNMDGSTRKKGFIVQNSVYEAKVVYELAWDMFMFQNV